MFNTPPITPTWRWLCRNPICFLGFGFGTGLAPKAPGTFGTLPALPLAWLVWQCHFPFMLNVLIALLLCAVGIPICGYTEKMLGRQDYGGIVWDEIAAMFLILMFIPFDWLWWLAAFLLFRFFDAVKPWPIRWFDARVHGGFGIMLDDWIAAAFSLLVLYLFSGAFA
ncbi:phosphatidylglycerophosphatase A family protein [Stenoxybacter acetivorans]|uniref:phosphatidylglycerophosphatase A family protein n=1 Tax=Stenoxybacter acetivorans TaxID=422441 RepID=UPI000AADD290|nr:phosphatidylglycerophosphatase A [Stenoxybacter acetivorans]